MSAVSRRFTNLTRIIRESVDSHQLVDEVLAIARDGSEDTRSRLKAYQLLMEHGWGRPPQAVALSLGEAADSVHGDFAPGTFRAAILALLAGGNGHTLEPQ